MKIHRIKISAWTASFRYPNLISGAQPTLEVPPLSTILGLVNAAAGQYLQHQDLRIGYYFEFGTKEFDLETIYQIDSNSKGQPTNNAKSNVIQREFLFDVQLWLYVNNKTVADYFRQPHYALLLGRSGDLATIEGCVEEIDLPQVSNAQKVKGQLVPLRGNFLAGKIQALPRYFTDTFPRQNLGTEPFSIIPFNVPDRSTSLTCLHDATIGKNGVDVFMHTINLSDYGD